MAKLASGLMAVSGFLKLIISAIILFVVLGVIGIFSGTFILMMGFMVLIFVIILLMVVVIEQPKGKGWIIVAGSIVMILVFLSVFGSWILPMSLKPGDYHDKTAVGVDRIAGGNLLSAPIDVYWYGGFKDGEMLDSVAYTASHRSSGPGETVHIWTKVCQTGGSSQWASRLAYFIYFSTGSSWQAEPTMVIELPFPPQAICPQMSNLNFGSVKLGADVGYLKVQLYVRAWADGYNSGFHDHIVVEDMAEVRSGVGAIVEPKMGYLAKVGETVSIRFRLGWGCSVSTKTDDPAQTLSEGGGWSAAIYSEARSMMKVAEWTTADLGCGGTMTPDYKTVTYKVQSDDFDNEGGCKQTLFIELYNNLFAVAEKYVYTLDVNKAFELPKPTIKADKTDVYVGATVTFTAESSTADAEYLWVAAYLDGEILKTQNGTSSTFEVTPNRKGEMEITVNCRSRDDCSFSQPDSIKIMVYDKDETIPPPFMDWIPYIILLILLIVLPIIIAFLPIRPLWLKILLAIILILIVIGVAWGMGFFE